MKKITIISLIVCSAFVFSACSPRKEIDKTASTTPTPFSTKENSNFSLRQLLTKNIVQKCTWKISSEQDNGQGEIIISNNKFKQSIKISSPEGEVEFFNLSDGEWLYSWSNNSVIDNMAFKMKIDETSKSEEKDQSIFSQIDLDQQLNYNCQPITLNEEELKIPQDIQFIDYSEFVNQF